MVVALILVDDDDGGLLPEVAGLLLGEDGHVGGVLLFMGVVEFFFVFLSGEVVFSSPSSLFFSLLCDGVALVWAWAWWGVFLTRVVDGMGVLVCVWVSRWAWSWLSW